MSDRVKGKVAPEDSRKWKCNWIECLDGCGLAGNGRCSADGEWDNVKCPQFNKVPNHMKGKPMSEFRSKVNDMDYKSCTDTLCQKYYLDCAECHTDRICAVLRELVEGMPKLALKTGSDNKAGCMTDCILFNSGADEQYEACKKFMLEVLDGH